MEVGSQVKIIRCRPSHSMDYRGMVGKIINHDKSSAPYRVKLAGGIRPWFRTDEIEEVWNQEPFGVTIASMAGETRNVVGFKGSDTLRDLRLKVCAVLSLGENRVATFVNPQINRRMTPMDDHLELYSLGIQAGTTLLAVCHRAFYEIKSGLGLLVSGAGFAWVNGLYKSCVWRSWSPGKNFAQIGFAKEGFDGIKIIWYKKSDRWPAGWYFQTRTGEGIYHQSSLIETCLPLDQWEVYTEGDSCPGVVEPAPTLDIIKCIVCHEIVDFSRSDGMSMCYQCQQKIPDEISEVFWQWMG